jgi:hypothetical protein
MQTQARPGPVVIACMVALLAAAPALADSPLPSSFHGTVKIDGENAPDDILILALIDGDAYALGYTQTEQGNSVYSLEVPGDDPDTPELDGGREGDRVQFEVDGVLADQTGIWHSGTNVQLNLTMSTSSTPTPLTPTPTPSPTPTATRPQTTWPSPTPTITPSPTPTKTHTPTNQPSPTPAWTDTPTRQLATATVPSPTPTLTVSAPGQFAPTTMPSPSRVWTPTPSRQPVLTSVPSPVPGQTVLVPVTSTLSPTSTRGPAPARQLATTIPPAYSSDDPYNTRLTGLLLIIAAFMIVFVTAAVILVGTVIWAVRQASRRGPLRRASTSWDTDFYARPGPVDESASDESTPWEGSPSSSQGSSKTST